MSNEILQRYYSIYTGVWKLFRKHCDARSDEDFNQLLEDAEKLRVQYPGQLASGLIQATLWEIDRRAAEHGYEKGRCKKDRG